MGRRILEREHELAQLSAAARAAAAGDGSVVLLSGEAGIGKSSVVQAIRSRLPAEGRMLLGHCDDLATARVLGPFRDLIGSVGPDLTAALTDGVDRDMILAAVRSELDWTGHPTVLAIEDVQWADDATLDVLRYLIRRMANLPALLLLTYRDDELHREHPMTQLLGVAAVSERVHRMPLRRLSSTAVSELSAGRDVDAEEIFAVTGGNPFFVNEVLATQDGAGVPRTVVDAVLARLRGLDRATQDAVEQLSVVPSAIDRWLLDALLPGSLSALVSAEERGLLTVAANRVVFRHELTRRAIADALPLVRRAELNQRVLAALVEHEGADTSQIVHHATEAGDPDAITRFAPLAARAATEGRAHREAAAHYRLVLEQRESFPLPEQADLHERSAIECYLTGDMASAVADQRQAVAIRRTLGDPVELGACLPRLSRYLWLAGDRAGADATAEEAVAVLARTDARRLLAMAHSGVSYLHMLADRGPEAVEAAERAILLARETGDTAVLSHALTNQGAAKWQIRDPGARATSLESISVALAADETEHALRAYTNFVDTLLNDYSLKEASTYLSEAIELAEQSEQLIFVNYFQVLQAMVIAAAGRWDEAIRTVERGLEPAGPLRSDGLAVIGRAMVRSGQDATTVLDEASLLTAQQDEPQRTVVVAAVLCEAAWLRGDLKTVHRIARPMYDEICRRRSRRLSGEFAYWLAKVGDPVTPLHPDDPYALQAVGRWQEAAEIWREAGYPYEHAAALAESPETSDQLEALAQLDAIDARPLARLVRARLRAAGVTSIPRGPLAESRQNEAGLTRRQFEVLRLVADGLSDNEIAERLVISVRTASNHVAAILDKLRVNKRQDAAARAQQFFEPPPSS
ncbi:ATP-binding protein [Kribbella catacumbae]|uniref:ATP-binding protein n=1 Tax=Kribbella catacumbae TaxID=460086 RepID=UPI00039A16D6|nr:AAA family ATPase [Kribbella catacumbae]